MSARDDFGSGARSPGGWGGHGNARTAAGSGGHGSLGGARGSNASGMGGLRGIGGGFGGTIRKEALGYLPRGAQRQGGLLGDEYVQITDIPGVMKKKQVPTSYPGVGVEPETAPWGPYGGVWEGLDPVTNNPFTGTGSFAPKALSNPPGYPGHPSHPSYNQGQRPINSPSISSAWNSAYGGYRPGRSMGAGQQGTTNWKGSGTTATKTGSVSKDQSRVPQNNATYAGMGHDFRSINGW